jgi:hypothetical protein
MFLGFTLEFHGIKAQHKLIESMLESVEKDTKRITESSIEINEEDISF